MSKRLTILSLTAVLLFSASPMCYANDDSESAPVDLQADRLIHDDSGQKVTALGDVILIQQGREVKADKIDYYLQEDRVVATGNVEFTDQNGDKYVSERVEFDNALKDGFIEGLTAFLVDGSRFLASNGRYESGNKTVMKDAFYTPCEYCRDGEDITPLWQIRASEVTHNKDEQTTSYRNARFELKGVPIGYLPYFSHPDQTVERKSGFLAPSAGFKSDQGFSLTNQYYWSIAPDKDMTVGLQAMTDATPLAMVEWRQRWDDASLEANTSFTHSERKDDINGETVLQDEELRGHLDIDAQWDMNDKWRSGLEVNLASDDQYLRQYDFPRDNGNVLENQIYVERFSGRNYATGRVVGYQDVRVEENQQDQPFILPEIEAHFMGDPNTVPVIGGRWSYDVSALSLLRDDDQQDVNRLHNALGWQRRFVSDYGLVSTLDFGAQSTIYSINDRTESNGSATEDKNITDSRDFAYVNLETSYPFAKSHRYGQLVLEPIASVTYAPDISEDEEEITNEDSLDVQLDSLNLFNVSRFPGVDGVEDGAHTTYGLRLGHYGSEGSKLEGFLGQSYRFDKDDNPFAVGSGLDDRNSDVVGYVSARLKENFSLDYKFQLDNDSFAPQRHEVNMDTTVGKFSFKSQYLFAKALDDTDITETREQIRNAAEYYINDRWRLFGAARHDLGEDPGLRTAAIGFDYEGACTSLSLTARKKLTESSAGDSATEIFLRIGFKNLGEIETSGFELGGGGD